MKEQIILVLKETIPEMVDAIAKDVITNELTLTESEKMLVVATVKGRTSRIADYSAVTGDGKSVFFSTAIGKTSFIADLYDVGNEAVQNALRRAGGMFSADIESEKEELTHVENIRKFTMSLYTEVAESFVAMALSDTKGGN